MDTVVDQQAKDMAALLKPEVLADIRRIELKTRKRASADLMGNYKSAFRGSGLVFDDLREYAPGDEVKNIHWKATARSPHPYVKTFQEDRQLRVLVALDTSASLLAGAEVSRMQLAKEFVALVSLLATRGNDQVGLALFAEEVESYLPPKASKSQFKKILLGLVGQVEHRESTNLQQSLRQIMEYNRAASLIFIVSDFYSPPFEDELRALSRRHDVILAHICGEPDIIIPDMGLVRYRASEGGLTRVVDTSSKYVRRALLAQHKKRLIYLRELSADCGAELISLNNNASLPLFELMRRRTNKGG